MRKPDGVVEIFFSPASGISATNARASARCWAPCVSVVFWHPDRLIGGMCHCAAPAAVNPAPEGWTDATRRMKPLTDAAGSAPPGLGRRLPGSAFWRRHMFPDLPGGRGGPLIGTEERGACP